MGRPQEYGLKDPMKAPNAVSNF